LISLEFQDRLIKVVEITQPLGLPIINHLPGCKDMKEELFFIYIVILSPIKEKEVSR